MFQLFIVIVSAMLLSGAIGAVVALYVTQTKWYMRYALRVSNKMMTMVLSDNTKKEEIEGL